MPLVASEETPLMEASSECDVLFSMKPFAVASEHAAELLEVDEESDPFAMEDPDRLLP